MINFFNLKTLNFQDSIFKILFIDILNLYSFIENEIEALCIFFNEINSNIMIINSLSK